MRIKYKHPYWIKYNWDLSEHHNKFIYDNRYKLAPFYLNVTNSVLITINAIMGFVDFCRVNNYSFFIFDGLISFIYIILLFFIAIAS